MKTFDSWGRVVEGTHDVRSLDFATPQLPTIDNSILGVGYGRSYGDSCLNTGHTLLDATTLNKILAFDRATGEICCQAGVSLAKVLEVTVPAGWFLPVSPGTKFVSIAGAVANDVHGKNHHHAGTFGMHVKEIELLRSDRGMLVCSPESNSELFHATIGGLGLTGLIVSVRFQLRKIDSPYIDMESIQFESLEEFFALSTASQEYEHTVAWLDSTAAKGNEGRGVFMRGNHTARKHDMLQAVPATKQPRLSVPFDVPAWFLNRYTIKLLNEVYYRKQVHKHISKTVWYDSFFYPLDSIGNWNRIYGNRGFFQFQCVLPKTECLRSIKELIGLICESGMSSFLTVIKEFGDARSPGMLTFPRKGLTMCFDFPNRGETTRLLMAELEQLVVQSNGALYPAKDACMSAESFRSFYPHWEVFSTHIDPAFSSDFWRRVTRGE